jgi:hypothetical protein
LDQRDSTRLAPPLNRDTRCAVANEGPFIQAAAICERVLQEQDGAVSAIRIIDRITFISDPDGRPLVATQPVWFLIALKSGSARGRHAVSIVREEPSGISAPVLSADLLFEGEERGANLVVQGAFQPEEEGLYWFDVFLGETRLTRMPLRAVFQRLPTAGPQPA